MGVKGLRKEKKGVSNARAKLLFCSLDILFCHILVAVVFVICSRCLMSRSYNNSFFPFFWHDKEYFNSKGSLPYLTPKSINQNPFRRLSLHTLWIPQKLGVQHAPWWFTWETGTLGSAERLTPTLSAIKREYPYLTLPLPFSLKLLTRDPSGRGIKPIRRETRSKWSLWAFEKKRKDKCIELEEVFSYETKKTPPSLPT